MSNGQEATAAPTDITLGGITYRMSPLTDKDTVELENWLRARIIKMARDSLDPKATEQDERITMDAAMRYARSITWMSGEGAREMGTLDGIARVVWQGVQHNHPDVTHEEIRRAMMSEPDISFFQDSFDAVNFPREGKKKIRVEQRPAKQNRRR